MGRLTYTTQEAQDRLDAVGTLVRPNLLENWYFYGGGSQQGGGQFPINQRGQTSYSGGGYEIDRWWWWTTNNLTLSNGETRLNGIVVQKLDPVFFGTMLGSTLTISALVSGVGLITSTRQWSDTDPIDVSGGAVSITAGNKVPGYNINYPVFVIQTTAPTTIYAAKLELGTTQTLAHWSEAAQEWVLNEVPNYQQELAKCQRYYQLYQTQSIRPTYAADCRPVMRANPAQSTITISGVTYYANSADL